MKLFGNLTLRRAVVDFSLIQLSKRTELYWNSSKACF